MSLGPFDLSGGPFLTLYTSLLLAAIVAGLLIPRWLRPEGNARDVTDAEGLAFLAGGPARFADTVVSRLLANGGLTMAGKDEFRVETRGGGATDAERAVLALPSPVRWPAISASLARQATTVQDKLTSAGLLMDSATVLQMRFWQTAPYLLLIVFGAIKWEIGTGRGRPVGFLTALLFVTALLAILRFAIIDRLTRGGIEVLGRARTRSERLERAPTSGETDLAVALFGTAVLVGSGAADFHRMRASSTSNSSGCGSSSGDGGGGGCGGGGCGGCGGS